MRKLFFILLILLSVQTYAQELKCNVQVTTPQIQSSDKKIYETLRTSIREFMNEKKWTNNTFAIEEKIECSILINISERISTEQFKATIQIQSRRPVFNSSYNSVMFNFIDKDFTFQYEENQPLKFTESSYTSNLASVLAYYAYIVIGLDFDSFSLYGGTTFYEKAQTIINNAQSSPDRGWKAFENKKNRYWLVENFLNQSYNRIRNCIYLYHRKGLDIMTNNQPNARGEIIKGLELFQKVNREKPGLFIKQMFFTAKSDELVNIFSESSPMEKTKVVKILKELDPSNSGKYNKIINKE